MSPKALEVVHLDTATEWRGGQQQLLYLVQGMVARGLAPLVACPPASPLWLKLEGSGARRIAVPAGWSLRTGFRVARLGADLVAAHTSHAHQCMVPHAMPLVVHRRVDFVPSGGRKYRRPDAYITVSAAVGQIIRAAGGSDVHVVFDGVPALPVQPAAADGPPILAVGARVPHKGHVFLAEAAQLLRRRGVLACLDDRPGAEAIGVAGEGPLTYAGLRWLGHRADVPALLAAARIFVHPSIEEGMGQAVIEAMHAGVPVVCTDAGGLPEVVGDAAVRVAPGDAVALADGLARALSGEHPDISVAKRRAKQYFDVDLMVEGTLAVYHQVAAQSRAARRPGV